MRENHRSARLAQGTLAAAAVCVLLDCLPTGNPPVGQHVLADRTLTGVHLSPSERAGVPSYLLVTGPLREAPGMGNPTPYAPTTPSVSDLYAIPYVGPAGTAQELATAQRVVEGFTFNTGLPLRSWISTDRLGRLLVVQYAGPLYLALRVDLVAQDQDWLGTANVQTNTMSLPLTLSPTRTHVFVENDFIAAVCDLYACQSVGMYAENGGMFVGEDFYFASDDYDDSVDCRGCRVSRIKADARYEGIFSSSSAADLHLVASDRAPRVLVSFSPMGQTSALLDTSTLSLAPLPPETAGASFVSASSSGHWLLLRVPVATSDSEYSLVLLDWTTGAIERVESSQVGKKIDGMAAWRPGRDELWFATRPDGFGVWKPAAAVKAYPGLLHDPAYPYPSGLSGAFSRDGRLWFSQGDGERPPKYVGLADDPAAPVFPLNSRGTVVVERRETSDGHLLVGTSTVDFDRQDMYLIEPETGASRVLCSGGHLLALGRSRALALLNWETSTASGELTLIDLATSTPTLLAENVYAVAVDRGVSADVPPETDALAPGTRVAFLTRNRIASAYDGLWVATLP